MIGGILILLAFLYACFSKDGFRKHSSSQILTGVLLCAVNFALMMLLAKYGGYRLMVFVMEKINFTIVPYPDTMYAVGCALIIVYCISFENFTSLGEWLVGTLITSVLTIVMCFFWYGVALAIILFVLWIIAGFANGYTSKVEKTMDKMPGYASTYDKMKAAQYLVDHGYDPDDDDDY